ncbi:hypothetical protein Q5O24_05715 [Eubacteriaceae bacterium ES3]|nr:hypothetical protein Q5O24_05715 [Eubacteriaceae bacterium ES3]
MDELDNLMECMGFNETRISDFVDGIPYKSNVKGIMKKLQKPTVNPFEQWLVLGYIILIAFGACVSRFLFMSDSVKGILRSLIIGMIGYADIIQSIGRILSFGISICIIFWVLVGIFQYKNENAY